MQGDSTRLAASVVEELARSAGLNVDGERAERLRAEMERALVAVDALDAAIPADAPGIDGVAPFDAGWPNSRGRQST